MASITVRVGREEKEISGLTKRTTCWDVVLALLKDKQNISGIDGSSADGERQNSAANTGDETGSASSSNKSIKELAQSYCIVESWRGGEKPIPPRTRILQIMQILEKQRGQVVLSLKKSKHIAYSNGHKQLDLKGELSGHMSPSGDVSDPTNYISRLSKHQKRRIRHNLKQHKKAILLQTADGESKSEDLINNNKDRRCKSPMNIQNKNKSVILSEELFVDGVICDSLVRPDRAELISLGAFNQEYCTYRRRGKHRRGSIDSESLSMRLRRDSVPHFPYSHHHRRRRPRHSSSSKYNRRYSTDDTSTATSTELSSEDEKADDADDEKSLLTEYGCTNNLRRPRINYNPTLVPCIENVITDLSTTATDSCTTTSGDSISSNGCSTSSGSSETSSWGDCALERSMREYCKNKGVNFKPGVIQPPPRFLRNNDQYIAPEICPKPKKTKSILGNMSLSKPAQSIIETFRRSNSKRGSKSNKKTQNKKLSENNNKRTTLENKSEDNNKRMEPQQVQQTSENTVDETQHSTPQTNDVSEKCSDDQQETELRDQLMQRLLSQNEILNNQAKRLAQSDVRIEQIETDIHQLRERAHGKNYVQNAYMSESSDTSDYFHKSLSPSCGQPVTTKWIIDCDNINQLSEFIETSNEIVKTQIQIEEYQRKVDIILQDMQEEVWRVSAEGCSPTSATAALVFGKFSEDADSDNEHGELSVCNSTKTKPESKEFEKKSKSSKKDGISTIEVETMRTELETSLYYSLRLNAELEEVEHILDTSDNLIQHKGEELIRTVRELAMSDEGISPDLWEEYGDLLTAYDLEIQHRDYLEMLEAAEALASTTRDNHESEDNWSHKEQYRIDATSPNPIIHLSENINHQNHQQPEIDSWKWCEHCKMEENMKHHKHDTPFIHDNYFAAPPRSFSDLPLPNVKTNVKMLPMPPVTIGSDTEDNKRSASNRNSTDSSSSEIPGKSSFADIPSSNSTDDSGNASAESTSSGESRNSSCDGGSPRPYPDDKNTSAFFGRNSSVRGSWKEKFSFSSQKKQESSSPTNKYGKAPPPPPPAHTKPTLAPKLPPKLPPKPLSMTKPVTRRSSVSSPVPQLNETKPTLPDNNLQQQQKLIRRNTSGKGKQRVSNKLNAPSNPPLTANNLTSFGCRGGSFRDGRIKNLSLPFPDAKKNNSRCNTPIISTSILPTNRSLNEKNRQINYDNDSDTGLSSLHSTDSDHMIYSETLV